jgi:RNase P subunit RPR2
MVGKSWSYANDRRVIELAKASKSLEEAARIMKRKPERIRKVAMRLGVSIKTEKKKIICHQHCRHNENGGRNAGPRGVASTLCKSAIPSKADIRRSDRLVRFVPGTDVQ